jgi:hypothetical protein
LSNRQHEWAVLGSILALTKPPPKIVPNWEAVAALSGTNQMPRAEQLIPEPGTATYRTMLPKRYD